MQTSTASSGTPPIKRSLFVFASLIFLLVASCDNGAKKRQQDLDDLNTFVTNQKDSADKYAAERWAYIDSEYNAKKAGLEKDTANMNAEMRTKYYSTVSQWDTYKTNYSKKMEESKATSAMDSLRRSLALTGVKPDFTDVTSDNILPVFEYFVTTVRNNKDSYTADQWTVVNVSWKALKGRKRELAKDIKPGDTSKILKQQAEYVGIKAANRTFNDDDDTMKE